MVKKHIYTLIVVLLFSCGASKKIDAAPLLGSKMKAKQILKAHQNQKADFSTLQARLKLELTEGNKLQTHTLTLRMERGKTIWVNAFLNMVRLKITPETVQMYNKLDHTFFDGDYEIVNDFLGIELNFSNLENILLGDALFNPKTNALKREPNQTAYVLAPKNINELLQVLYYINPGSFKLEGQSVYQPLENRSLDVNYQGFQAIDAQLFPKSITIKVFENQKGTSLKLNLKSVILNQPLQFPFKMPSGYKPIDL
tara:strand:- start:337 stop:1101 length:765 start_codon:yes stop_codon:yes gene_type:complete